MLQRNICASCVLPEPHFRSVKFLLRCTMRRFRCIFFLSALAKTGGFAMITPNLTMSPAINAGRFDLPRDGRN